MNAWKTTRGTFKSSQGYFQKFLGELFKAPRGAFEASGFYNIKPLSNEEE
jgi:hypothetical protein